MLMAAYGVNRTTPSGRVAGPEQRIEIHDALRAVTIEAAYSWRREHELGSIEVGKIANLTALDSDGLPVYWNFLRAAVVRDGVVVDFQGAVEAVRSLKMQAEAVLGCTLNEAATAYPPALPAIDCRACHFVLQQAGIDCRILVDEVSAANALLKVRDGALVDVGGGSTGVGVFRQGKCVSLSDRAGGGHQLDLILAGALRISVDQAETHKRENGTEVASILRPGIERIAESIRRQCNGTSPGTVHLAGGALRLPQADLMISHYLGWPVQAYDHAELITPFGIAVS